MNSVYYLVFDDWYGSPFLVLKANLNINELEIFKHEVVQYTKHIKALDQGQLRYFAINIPRIEKGGYWVEIWSIGNY